MHILIAPNAFKNSLSAEDAALAIKEGLMKSNLRCTCTCFPIGDGGDGTDDLIIKKFEGTISTAAVHDPLGRKIQASFGITDSGKTAVIGMAKASGIDLLRPGEPDPLRASSFGTGQQIINALDKGVTKIIIGMGGSATVDGGAGILNCLGIKFLDREGKILPPYPAMLANLAAIDTTALDQRIFNCEIIVLCDVENVLLGKHGAAAVFGPQKGASPEAVTRLDSLLRQFAAITLQQTGKDISAIMHGGTAGGAAAGLYAFLNAKLVKGIAYFLELTNFDAALEQADLLITGEGSIDEQTLQGKAPLGVASKAKSAGIPVVALAGKVPIEKNKELQPYFDVLLSIGNGTFDLPAAIADTKKNIIRTSWELGNLLAMKK